MRTKLVVWVPLVLVLACGSRAMAQSASELLEKAIYTEETVGDLNEAVKIYARVVSEAKTTRGYAAQAQYRLGMCYSKMGKKDEATAALKKLVDEFSDQKELVAKARKLLNEEPPFELLPVPWVDGEALQLTARLATGLEIGAFVLSVRADEVGGGDVWRMQIGRYIALNAPNQGVSRVVVDKTTMRPQSSLFRHSILGKVEADYTESTVTVNNTGIDGKQSNKELNLDGTYYDNEQAMFLLRQLPLKVGTTLNVPVCSTIGAGPIKLDLEVKGKEMVEVPAGKFECYKAIFSQVQQTFWYSADEHRYLVKFEAGGVVVELASIRQNKPKEIVDYRNDKFAFTVSAPTEWYLFEHHVPGTEPKEATYLIADPEAAAMSALVVQPLAELNDEEKTSPRAWADSDIRDAEKAYKEFKVRPASWQERQLAGHPAVSFVADYLRAGRKMVQYSVYSHGDTNAVVFSAKMEPDWLDHLKKPLDVIVNTYRTN